MTASLGTVAVLGGGISGLTAAYRLTKVNPIPARIVLLEAQSHIGGWVQTIRNEDGVIYESGPRTMRPVGEAGNTVLNLLQELGLRDQVIHVARGHPATMNRYIYVDQKLVRLPTEISAVFKATPPFKKPLISAFAKDLVAKKNPEPDESMYDFVSRRLGDDLADYAIDPLVRGVCAGDAKEISVNFLLKSLKEAEQSSGRVSLGLLRKALQKKKVISQPLSDLARQAKMQKWAVWSLQGGLQTLPEVLAEKAAKSGAELFIESPCTGLEFRSTGGVVVRCGKEEFLASRVISALPAHKLAALVEESHPNLAALLNSIEAVTVGVVNMEWPGRKLNQDAFGFLVPSSELLPLLGVVYDTCSFPQGDRTILTAMMGGKWFQSLFGNEATEERLFNVAQRQVEFVLGISDPPTRSKVHILRNCIPQYVVGHSKKVEAIRHYIQENRLCIDLIGASFDGVSVNDCIHNATETVNNLTIQSSKT